VNAEAIAPAAVIPANARNQIDAPSSRHSRESGNPVSFARYPKYKDSGVEWLGEVPNEWLIVRLKQACTIAPSNIDKKSYDGQRSVRLCNYTDVYYNDEITEQIEFMAATATDDHVAKFSLKADDVLITKDSETPDDIAVPAYVPCDLNGVVCGYHLALLRPLANCSGRYLKYLFYSRYLRSMFAVAANGLTRYGLSQYALDNAEAPFPPIHEQKAIAAFLDRETAKIDALIAEQEKLIALLKEKRQALISHAVTKGLDPNAPMKDSGIEWLGQVPVHWEIRGLRTLASIVRGASPRPAGDPELFDGEFVPWVTVAEITKDESPDLTTTSNYLTERGAQASRTFKAGTLLYSNSGATLGVPKLLRMDACANDGVVGFENLASTLSTDFLYWFLRALTPTIRDLVKQGSGQPNLNTDIVGSIRIGLPPVDEQVAIVDSIKATENAFSTLSAQCSGAIDRLKERRAALISAAVTGKIDVRHVS